MVVSPLAVRNMICCFTGNFSDKNMTIHCRRVQHHSLFSPLWVQKKSAQRTITFPLVLRQISAKPRRNNYQSNSLFHWKDLVWKLQRQAAWAGNTGFALHAVGETCGDHVISKCLIKSTAILQGGKLGSAWNKRWASSRTTQNLIQAASRDPPRRDKRSFI